MNHSSYSDALDERRKSTRSRSGYDRVQCCESASRDAVIHDECGQFPLRKCTVLCRNTSDLVTVS
jgi:hypothetical protein